MTNIPAGWYPDPEDATKSRWWDGVQWTDHRAATYPMATVPYSSSLAELKAPEGTPWNTVWIWLVVFVPYLSSFGVLTIDWSRLLDLSAATSELAMLNLMLSPGYLISVVGGMIAYGLSVWFAYLDYRELERRQVPRPFHWAWAFLSYSVYPIGRSVVVRRRTGRGISPMWVSIALIVLSFIFGIVLVVVMMTSIFTQIANMPGVLIP